jgi:Ca-activated chloride channel family protein
VQFTDGASLVQPPTTDREALMAAIGALHPQMGTAIGQGILESLQALFPQERIKLEDTSASAGASSAKPPRPRPAEPDAAVAIVLLTDGQNTEGPSPTEAALLAAQKGVRVYTVGIGTPVGLIRQGSMGAGLPVGIDEDALKGIASLTRAEYFYARTAPDLTRIYSSLGAKLALERNAVEISALFCALGALALCASAGLSALRSGRIV